MRTENKTIWQRRGLLDKERREARKALMEEYDKVHYAKVRELHLECEKEGHQWSFTHFGPLNNPWFCCVKCGLSRVEEA